MALKGGSGGGKASASDAGRGGGSRFYDPDEGDDIQEVARGADRGRGRDTDDDVDDTDDTLDDDQDTEDQDDGQDDDQDQSDDADDQDQDDQDADDDQDDQDDDQEDDTDDREVIKEQMRLLQERLDKQDKEREERPRKRYTDADYEKAGEKLGIAPQAVQFFHEGFESLREEVRSMIENMAGGLKSESTLTQMSREKGFSDIPRLRKDIDEFLNQFPEGQRSNRKLCEMAVKYARGSKVKDLANKIENRTERNRKILSRNRTESPKGEKRRRSGPPASKLEIQAMKLGGFKDVEEYRKMKSRNGLNR